MKQNTLFKISGVVLCLVAVSCSSGSKKSVPPSNEEYVDNTAEIDPLEVTPTLSEPKEDSVESVKTETPHTDDQALMDAIKSNNENSIHRAAIGVLSKNPNDVKALNAMGMYYYRRGTYGAAQLMFGKAIKVSPNSGELYNNLGLVYYAQKEQREAVKAWRKAIELNPNETNAAANVGSLYVEQKQFIKAFVALEIAYRKNSKDQKVLNNYGITLAAMARYPESQEMYKQAIKLNENNKDVMLNYAILLIDHMKKNQEGLDLLNKVKFLGPSPEARNKINLLENKAKAGIK